jgi:WD repeat-containing protein mio
MSGTEGTEAAVTFQTKNNNNLAIDYADQNYFASSALDSPGVMVWDRRALNRNVASASYLDALDSDDMPFGGALKLDRAVNIESDPQARTDRNSYIRKLAYCRDHRGMLAVLSRLGQLKVFSTQPSERPSTAAESESPQLLQVRKSDEMDNFYSEIDRKNERIVSFDWLTMPSAALRPRLLVLRANGSFEILDVPAFTRIYPYNLIPWQAPYRGLAGLFDLPTIGFGLVY